MIRTELLGTAGQESRRTFHDCYVCGRYEYLPVVETFCHSRNDRWLFGSNGGGERKALTAYFAWAAWAASANRPGKDYSYTNNWPYEPMAGNRPSTEAYVWSALSLITLLSGIGLILFVVGKFDY